MKVFFVTSEHPARMFGGLGTFTREYTKVLRTRCDVKVLYFHFSNEQTPCPDLCVDYVFCASRIFDAQSIEARVLENASSLRAQVQPLLDEFKPDLIHCNDRQTYLPFRFDTNVFYSSHLLFCDLLGLQGINDEYVQELKIERCAFSHAAVLAVYSRFAVQRALSQILAHCSPVVLPLAINPEQFYEAKDPDKIRVAYFGRFEDLQKGVSQFIGAVQQIGAEIKKQVAVEFSLFGKGEIPPSVDTSLFDNISFLEGTDLYDEFARTDIVVMPSRYEPFGLTGLEAMASGCLLLVTQGLGMDEYAVTKKNCLSIPNSAAGIAAVLNDAIIHFDSYADIRACAKEDAARWTWQKCVDAHYVFYSAIKSGTQKNIHSAYRPESYQIAEVFNHSVSPAYFEEEKSVLECVVELFPDNAKNGVLCISACESPVVLKNSCHLSVMAKNTDGVIYHLEYLPFDDQRFSTVYVVGAWETVMQPGYALSELFRICSDTLVVCYRTGERLPWQTVQMEHAESWQQCIHNETNWNVAHIQQIIDSYEAIIWKKIQ